MRITGIGIPHRIHVTCRADGITHAGTDGTISVRGHTQTTTTASNRENKMSLINVTDAPDPERDVPLCRIVFVNGRCETFTFDYIGGGYVTSSEFPLDGPVWDEAYGWLHNGERVTDEMDYEILDSIWEYVTVGKSDDQAIYKVITIK
jgi:hypothetical protein